MAEFKSIETQEELDEIIKDRLKRAKETAFKEAKEGFEVQLNELETLKNTNAELQKSVKENADKVATITTQLEEANKKVKGYEIESLKRKVASEAGLPDTLAGRIQGSTEDEMKEDAKSLAEVMKQNNRQGLPMANLDNEPNKGDQKQKAYKDMLNDLTEGE